MNNNGVIFLVEDEPFLASVLQLKLTKEGFKVIRASDGEEAINMLIDQGLRPDLILLDLILPKRNGFEVLETIRQEPILEKIPVIVISNLGQPSDIERGKSLGVIDYYVKAKFSIDELIQKIKEDYLRIKKQSPIN
ncbi:MAG: response regulator transcription factor [Candidatus Paceibacterota bacterium]